MADILNAYITDIISVVFGTDTLVSVKRLSVRPYNGHIIGRKETGKKFQTRHRRVFGDQVAVEIQLDIDGADALNNLLIAPANTLTITFQADDGENDHIFTIQNVSWDQNNGSFPEAEWSTSSIRGVGFSTDGTTHPLVITQVV